MVRYRTSVRALAQEAQLDPDIALLVLIDANIKVGSFDDTVPKSALGRARRALELPSRPTHTGDSTVTQLAAECDRPEHDVRDLLSRAGLLRKRRLKRVPKHFLPRAEELLGLRPSGDRDRVRDREAPTQTLAREKEPSPAKRERTLWPTIGPLQELTYLTPSDVFHLHCILVEDFRRSKDPIDPPGPRSEALLESAVHRQRTALGLTDKYPTVAMAGAALVHSTVVGHPFHNGNKRTALVSLLAFLDKNGWVLTVDQDDTYDLFLQLAQHNLVDGDGSPVAGPDAEVLHLAHWVQSHIRRVAVREFPLQFRHLRSILGRYGCAFEPRPGNRMNIRRGALQTQIFYRNEGSDVERNAIHKIRRDLELDEGHGYDSDIFYNLGPRIPEFINKYRKLLDRLAKV